MRLFIAIDVANNQEIMEIYDSLKKSLAKDKIRWVKAANMHITLKFLGTTPPEKLEDIKKLMKTICSGYDSTVLEFSQIGIFGSSYRPRIVWLGFKENDTLRDIAKHLKEGLVSLGWEYDRQNFVAHLTLGRISKINSKKYFQTVMDRYKILSIKPLNINKLILYQSILKKEGPEYRELYSVALKGKE